MLRVFTASGEEVAALDASDLDAMCAGESTVGALKMHLAEKHFEKRFSRFQLRLLRAGDPSELGDEEGIQLPMDVQLMLMQHLPAHAERDKGFVKSCEMGHVDEVEQCLKAPQDPSVQVSADRQSGLFRASGRGHLDVVRLLLEAGAKTELGDCFRTTPLHQAAVYGHPQVARLLLDARADTEARDRFRETALHAAAGQGHVDLVRQLLDAGADKEAREDIGHRPLHVAAKKGHLDVVRLLVDSRADAEAEDEYGRMPYEAAEDPQVAQWFRENSIERGCGATKSY